MLRISRLDAQGFRGITQQSSLLFDSKSLLLFGENGTGKSSFVDVIERLLVGKVSTLDGRGAGLSSERHGPSILSSAYPTQLAIQFNDSASTVVTTSTRPESVPAAIQGYLAAARENVYILRRSQLLGLIESKPKERYDFLRRFLPLEGAEALEDALRQAKDLAASESLAAGGRLRNVIEDLRRLFPNQYVSQEPTEQELLEALREDFAAQPLPIPASIDALPGSIKAFTEMLASFGDVSRQTRLGGAVRDLEELAEAVGAISLLPALSDIETLRERERSEAQHLFEDVLERGLLWIQREGRHTCPLCEQSIDVQQIETRVRLRLDTAAEIIARRKEARDQLSSLRTAVRSTGDILRRAERMVAVLPPDEAGRISTVLASIAERVGALETEISGDSDSIRIDTLRRYVPDVGQGGALAEQLASARDELYRRLAELPSAEKAERALTLRDRVSRLVDLWPRVKQTRRDVARAARATTAAGLILDAAQAARKEEVQALFDEFAGDIATIYTKLHPDEHLGGLRLEVRQAVEGSANIRGRFYDRENEDPRAYFSEAHLDTLGISIFLALRRWYRRRTPSFDLLVLDDVLTSVDAAHAIRLAELLLNEFGDYQLFLTTHDRIWFEHLRDIQARCGAAQNFVNKVIHKWTIEEGPDLREPEEERHALERLLDQGAAQEIAWLAGRLLEHILQEMRYSLRLSIEAKRGERYEIGDLWPAFYRTIKREYPTLYEIGRSTFENLDVRWPLRNLIGAHPNDWARNVSRVSAVEFGKVVSSLFDLVYCPDCRRFVSPSAVPAGQLSCRCGGRIYPAKGKPPLRPVSRDDVVRTTEGSLRTARLDTSRYLDRKRAEAGRED